MKEIIDALCERFPDLAAQRSNILRAIDVFKATYATGGTLYVCGNGGSAADAEHIVGELLKGFLRKRPVSDSIRSELKRRFGDDGEWMANRLQCGLPAVSLTGHPSFSTAFGNDVSGEMTFAQHLFALGKRGDALLAISTSGNSQNVIRCLQMANVLEIESVAMTGVDGGRCAELANCAILAPAKETYRVQEFHLPIYHAICACLEELFHGGGE